MHPREHTLHDAQVQPGAHGDTRFHRLLDKLPAAAYTCDRDGLITYFNRHAVQLWGRAPRLRDAEDRYCGSFKLFSADGTPIPHERCWMALALQEGREFNGQEIVIERADGGRIAALAHANPIYDDLGRLLGAVNVLVDISGRKRAEDLLREADRSKDEFIATLAHELRNPLAPIRNAVQILQHRVPPIPDLQWALEVIERQMHQMMHLVDDLLDLGRVTSNKLELDKTRRPLVEAVHTALQIGKPLIEASGQQLELDLPPEAVYIEADLPRLAQVISNLLNNASKFTARAGRIVLSARREGDDAVVRVRDTGIGIPAEMLPRIFEPFTQVDHSLERATGGLGIGLTLARRVVELHGGSLSAHSEGPGKGSEFVVRLPLAAQAPQARDETRHPDAAPPRPGLTILVVDDNVDSAVSLSMLLSLSGHQVRTAHDGYEGVHTAEEFRPNVVLLDIGLPGMNGYDTARRIREQPWGSDMLLIAITGWGQEADRHLSRDAGFDHHLVKPVSPVTLMQVLQKVAAHEAAA
jgi:PAS domain S-box-containing protein